MSKPIRYYFWVEMGKEKEWNQLGCCHGYHTSFECKKDNNFMIDFSEKNGNRWTILEAKPMV